tara:strand:+ start:6733 stop:7647 length:915 start_codon:yes stop_codon:yes gene_type:complete
MIKRKQNIQRDFLDLGVIDPKNNFKNNDCTKILSSLHKNFLLGKNIFKTEKQYNENQSSIGVNPEISKNNFALDVNLDFIEKNKNLKKTLTDILGKNYKIILKKFVVQVPERWIPLWVKKKIKKEINPNLNRYILPKYQKLTYFRGVDYHMDLIEHKKEKVKFVTLYIYLNKVGKGNSPLNILEKSFKFGATKFPHNLKKLSQNKIIYNNEIFNKKVLLGGVGSFYIWSCLNLHGAEENKSSIPRISLRYKIKSKNFKSKKNLIDKLFKKINGSAYLDKARTDVNEKNFSIIKKRVEGRSLIFK